MDGFTGAVVGAGLTGSGVLVYIAAKKGVPYVWNMVKGWWTSAKTDLTTLRGDVAAAHAKLATLEAAVAELKAKAGA